MTDDLIEKKKREEKRKLFISLYIAEILKIKEAASAKAWQRSVDDFFDKILEKPEESLTKAAEKAYALYAAAEYSREKRNEFFKLDDDSQAAELKESMNKLGLKESSFAALAFAAVGEKIGILFNFFSGKSEAARPREEIDEINQIRLDAVLKAKEAIFAFRNEKPQIFAKLLYGGIRMACEHFATEPDTKRAAQWSIHVEDMLELVKSNPVLLKESGLTERQLAIVENIAGRGRILREGLSCLEKLSKEYINGDREYSAFNHRQNTTAIIKMQLCMDDRSSAVKDWDLAENIAEKEPQNPVKDNPQMGI